MQLTPPTTTTTTPVAMPQPVAPSTAVQTPPADAGGGTLARDASAALDAAIGARPFWRRRTPSLPTVANVDLSRYTGLWYELARLPVRFQDRRSVSTAEYTLNPDGSVRVENTAIIGDRVADRIVGRATSANPGEDSRLRVKFGGLLRLIPTPKQGNYYVLDLVDDYSMALVGTPDRRNLWLLSRDPHAWGSADAQRMVERAGALGFDTTRLQVADWDRREMRSQD